jgi:hypothetical protein
MTAHIIRLGDEGQAATAELLRRFEAVRPQIGAGDASATASLQSQLRTLEAIDRQYGGSGPLPLEDADELLAATVTGLAHLESDCRRQGEHEAAGRLADLAIGLALWAVRHEVPLKVVEPVANALALRSNAAADKPALAAVFGLMQGVIAHVRPALAADLERSNPQRPWRLLHVNLAITAIRTEDEAMIDHAFDALDAALPDERASFYAEALSHAMGPRVAPQVRAAIERHHGRWNLS